MSKKAKQVPSALEYMTSQLQAAFAALGHAMGAVEEQRIEEQKASKKSWEVAPPKAQKFITPPPAGLPGEVPRSSLQGDHHYIVQDARVRMPCFGAYRRVAVLEVDANVYRVSSISPRAAGCRRVVAVWERRYVGNGVVSAYGNALNDAKVLAENLNFGGDMVSGLLSCSADCILPTAEELRRSRNWTKRAGAWGRRPVQLTAREIRARVMANPGEAGRKPLHARMDEADEALVQRRRNAAA